MSQLQSRDWLRTTIAACTGLGNHLQLHYRGQEVCQKAFKLLHGFSNNKFAQALLDSRSPYTLPVHGNIRNTNAERLDHRATCQYWIEEFITANGDIDPASGKVHIPAYLMHKSCWNTYN
jgi:hypothetical protein